jgi:hypothetical protein
MNSEWNEEMEYRRSLFKAAAKGDIRAQEELEREYHVRVYASSKRCQNNPQRDYSISEGQKADSKTE